MPSIEPDTVAPVGGMTAPCQVTAMFATRIVAFGCSSASPLNCTQEGSERLSDAASCATLMNGFTFVMFVFMLLGGSALYVMVCPLAPVKSGCLAIWPWTCTLCVIGVCGSELSFVGLLLPGLAAASFR